MDAITALHTRSAAPRLIEPAPSASELELVYQAALRAPDHAMLRPWKFLVIEGEGRNKLGQLFVDALAPEDEAQLKKLAEAPLRAPMLIIGVAGIQDNPKVPAIEQCSSTAAAMQNMSLALHALGYASIWRTGPPAFSDKVKSGLGLSSTDQIIGFLYLGTPTVTERPIAEHKSSDYFHQWP